MKRRLLNLLPPLPLVFPSVVSAVLLALCFAPVSAWPLSFVALVPLFAALVRVKPSRKDSFKTVYLCGVVYYTILMWWVVKLLPSAGATIPWLLAPATLIMAFYLSLYPALAFVLVSAVTRYRFLAFLLAAPGAWVAADLARSQGELSFPWGAIGYALSDVPVLIQSASAFGLSGLTFLVVLVNALIAGVLVLRDVRVRVVSLVCGLIVIGAMWAQGRSAMTNVDIRSDETVRAAIVQPNVDLKVKWKPEFKDSTLNLIERLTREAATLDADLIIFPETSAPVYIDGRIQTFKSRLISLSKELGVSVFTGFLNHRYDGPDGELNIFNSSGLFTPDGRLQKYDKNHLLPFGEQLPLSWKFRWVRKINFGQSNFIPGPASPPLETSGIKYTPLICFESVFPYLCRKGVEQGSELFVNITNDGWFGDTPGPFQHAQMAILRAVEFRRYLLRSANSGISMVVDPVGRVVMSLGLYQQGIIAIDVVPLTERTFYSRYRDWPMFLLCVLLVAVAALASRRHTEPI
jgi:apolipoprotein N-acyltransferase